MKIPRIIVCIEKGVVQDIYADGPVKVFIVDYDIDGAETGLSLIPQGNGITIEGVVLPTYVEVNAPRVDEITALMK